MCRLFTCLGKMIRTSRSNTTYGFPYEIRVTCFDETAGSLIGDTTDDTFVDVTFVDEAGPCTETSITTIPTTTTMSDMTTTTSVATTTTTAAATTITTIVTTSVTRTSSQGVVSTPESLGFFQTPTNAALVSFFGGALVGLSAGGVIHFVAKRCARKSAVGSSLK